MSHRINFRRMNRRNYRRAKNMHIRSGKFPTRNRYGRRNGTHVKRRPVQRRSDRLNDTP